MVKKKESHIGEIKKYFRIVEITKAVIGVEIIELTRIEKGRKCLKMSEKVLIDSMYSNSILAFLFDIRFYLFLVILLFVVESFLIRKCILETKK